MIFVLHSTHAKMFSVSFLHHLAQVLVLVCSATSDIRYVRPADSPLSSCPGQPCLTLHEYVEIDNFTNGATLQFLPGNHTLQQSFYLVNISNVTFEAAFNHSVTNIICKDNATIHSSIVTHFHIVGLSFILSQRGNISALKFRHSKSVFISDTVFQGRGEVTGRAIGIFYSEATISRCVFKGLDVTGHRIGGVIHSSGTNLVIHESSFINNVARSGLGGAIHSSGTNLVVHESSFINNVAHQGSAIDAHKSSLLLNKTSYYGNSAQGSGGAISCFEGQVDMVGNNTFHNNSCQRNGGAMTFFDSQLNIMYGIAQFHFNEARSGGAISLFVSSTLLNGSITMMKNKAADSGGGLYFSTISNSYIINVKQLTLLENAAGSEGGAMYCERGNVITLGGNVTIENNTANMGGGIRAVESLIRVVGNCDLSTIMPHMVVL